MKSRLCMTKFVLISKAGVSDVSHPDPDSDRQPLHQGDDLTQLVGHDEAASTMEYSIGELARAFKTTLRTLRFYEDKGLVKPRRVGLQRIYSPQDRSRLKLIVIGKKVGMSLEEIADMLEVYQLPKAEPQQLIAAQASMNNHINLLRERKSDIEQALRELHRTVEVVSGMLKAKQKTQMPPKMRHDASQIGWCSTA